MEGKDVALDWKGPRGASDANRSRALARGSRSPRWRQLSAEACQLRERDIERELAWIESYTAELGCSFGEALEQERADGDEA